MGGEFGRVDLAAGGAQLGAGEAKLLYAFDLGRGALLPHDKLIGVERRRESGAGTPDRKEGKKGGASAAERVFDHLFGAARKGIGLLLACVILVGGAVAPDPAAADERVAGDDPIVLKVGIT